MGSWSVVVWRQSLQWQIGTLWNTAYWSTELFLLEESVEAGKIVFIQKLLRWYNNKDVVRKLKAMQKMVEFYHTKSTDRLKLGCTLRNLANICLQRLTSEKFYPLTESD